MRILFVTATYPPSINGVAIATSQLKKQLESFGHKITVLAPQNPKARKEPNVIRYPSIPNPLIRDYPIPTTPLTPQILKSLKVQKFDIVHAHHPFYIGSAAKILAKIFRTPLVFTYHTRYEEYASTYAKFLPKAISKKLTEREVERFCRDTDLIISPAGFITQKLKERLPYLNVKTIPSGIPKLPTSPLKKEKLRKKLGLPPDKKIILSVGRLAPEKNVSKLIEALPYLPNRFHLVFVGGGIAEESLRKKSKEFNLERRVTFAGPVPHNKVHEYYQAADLFVTASKTETQGIVFLEASYFGLPIVAVKSEASQEWVKPKFGILTKDSPEELARAVLKLDTQGWQAPLKQAREFARRFTLHKTAKLILQAYRQAIEKHRA